jgi:recombination protein RecT
MAATATREKTPAKPPVQEQSREVAVPDRRAIALAERERSEAFKKQLRNAVTEFAPALPNHITPARFEATVRTAVAEDPALLDADRVSLFQSCLKAATDGLLPDKRDGALVVYNTKDGQDERGRDRWIKKVQWMPMIQGLLKKIRQSGELKTIRAQVVHANDKFQVVLGDDEFIIHEADYSKGDRGAIVAFYAIAETLDGGVYREIMSKTEVDQVREASKAKNAGPWTSWYGEMGKKTVLRRLSKRLPMSTDLQAFATQDDDQFDFAGQRQLPAAEQRRVVASPLSDDEPEPAAIIRQDNPPHDRETGEIQGQDQGGDQGGGGDPQGDQGGAPAVDTVETAKAKGGEAAKLGKRRIVPKEYAERPDLASAWGEEFDTVKAEIAEAGDKGE